MIAELVEVVHLYDEQDSWTITLVWILRMSYRCY